MIDAIVGAVVGSGVTSWMWFMWGPRKIVVAPPAPPAPPEPEPIVYREDARVLVRPSSDANAWVPGTLIRWDRDKDDAPVACVRLDTDSSDKPKRYWEVPPSLMRPLQQRPDETVGYRDSAATKENP